MSDSAKITEFPAIKTKLSAPTKKSIFERQKAEAEAKRKREEAETAAVYEDFVKSFEDDDAGSSSTHRGGRNSGPGTLGGGPHMTGGVGGLPRRHFAAPPTGPAAGRGGGGPGGRGGFGRGGHFDEVTGPPSRKRTHEGFQTKGRDAEHGLFAFGDSSTGQVAPAAAFQNSDDEDNATGDARAAEHIAPKPTLQLSSLPPGTSPAVIKSLLTSVLKVDGVRIIPPSGPASTERKSLSAIVTLAKDTPANDIDAAVNGLQNRYLGWGYYLSLARHLSSAALNVIPTVSSGLSSTQSSLPFGAKTVQLGGPMGRGPPSHRGGFAPPTSFAPSGPSQYGRQTIQQVSVHPPSDLKQLKLIHKTIESLLTHGPEFEALLMSRPEVQRDPKWAWIWDARSPGGIWYRWRLWEILSGSQNNPYNKGMPQYVFDGGAAWVPPKKGLRFEYVTRLSQFVSDSDYDSSEDDNSDAEEEARRRDHNHGGALPDSILGGGGPDANERQYLNPLQRAKLTHLLARLPTSTGRLRKGDVARVTSFAIEHAGSGADEVVSMIIANIRHPFAYTSANPDHKTATTNNENEDDNANNPGEKPADKKEKEKEDPSSAKLIALYLLSDILSSSSTSGVRHAWRYRSLFEAALKRHRVFEHLGRLDKDLQWGRLRAEKWKRSVGSVLALWEGWCVFPQESQEWFAEVFREPPATAEEEREKEQEREREAERVAARGRWKAVDAEAGVAVEADENAGEEEVDVDGEPMDDEDIDGVPMDEDDYFDGEEMVGDDGEPMEDVEEEGKPAETYAGVDESKHASTSEPTTTMAAPGIGFSMGFTDDSAKKDESRDGLGGILRKRPRPKAEDMFADSDED